MFLYSFHSNFADASTPDTQAGGSKQLNRRKMDFLRIPNFYEAIICTKIFFISTKENYYLKS